MTLDLRADAAIILDYLKGRVQDYPVYVNAGPGQDDAKITQITLGYSFDQAGWVALVFDTRPDAQCDGEWQAYIEETCYALPHWRTSIDALRRRGKKLPATLPGGSKTTIAPDAEQEDVAAVFGKVLHTVLAQACNEKVFAGLPFAKSCLVAIEEHEGAWGWLGKFDGKTLKVAKGPGGPKEQLQQAAARFSGVRQLDFWMDVLEKLASGTKCYVKPDIVGCSFATYEAARLGRKMTMPFLKLAARWAHECEFVGNEALSDRRPHGFIVGDMLSSIREDFGVASAEVEALLHEIMRKSLKANAGRKKQWGDIPISTANCLYDLFPGYPEPDFDFMTYHISNGASFLKKPKAARPKPSQRS